MKNENEVIARKTINIEVESISIQQSGIFEELAKTGEVVGADSENEVYVMASKNNLLFFKSGNSGVLWRIDLKKLTDEVILK